MDSPLSSAPPSSHYVPVQVERFSLHRWCLVAFSLFLIVDAVLRWPIVNVEFPDSPGTFFFWEMMGAFLFPLLIAWIFYRACGRSRTAASIALFILILVLGSEVVKKSSPGRKSHPATMASFGPFRFEIPNDWDKTRTNRENNKAMIYLRGESTNEPVAMIQVDAGQPALANPRVLAQALVEPDGRVLDQPVLVDGVEGIRAETSSTDLSRPRLAVIVVRNGRIYLIMGAGKKGNDVSDPFQHVLDTWRWTEE